MSPHARSIASRAVLATASVTGIVLVLVYLRAFTRLEAAVNGWLVRVTGGAASVAAIGASFGRLTWARAAVAVLAAGQRRRLHLARHRPVSP